MHEKKYLMYNNLDNYEVGFELDASKIKSVGMHDKVNI